MKKIIAILLALLCLVSVVSMVACGDGSQDNPAGQGSQNNNNNNNNTDNGTGDNTPSTETPDPFLEELAKAYAAKFYDETSATITFQSADEVVYLEMDVALTANGVEEEGDDPVDYIEVPVFNYVSFDEDNNIVLPPDLESTIAANPEATKVSFNLTKLNFNKEFCTYEKVTNTKYKFNITSCDGFFGTDVNFETATAEITLSNGAPKKFNIEYTTALGYEVIIEISFK